MSSDEEGPVAPDRRRFLLGALRAAGAATAAGIVWAGFVGGEKAYPLILRPPGATKEGVFLAKCTKCGLCAEACPYRAVIMAAPGDGRPIGTPYLVMRDAPCRMCRDIPCTAACPTGALDRALVSDTDESGKPKLNVNLTRMGLAVIDRETCVAYWGIQCDACYRACPVMDKAITVEPTRNEKTGKHALLAPVVHSDHCTGCGLCERACITKKASIFVLPRQVAMGESSERYVRGWDDEDEQRLEGISEETKTVTPRSAKDPVDYLNKEEF
jgi:ferredoxin-type protein NapG